MAKFKVGDKVRITNKLKRYEGGTRIHSVMLDHIGKVYEIVEIAEVNGNVRFKECCWYFPPETLKFVGSKEFTKADLREGDILTLRNGNRRAYENGFAGGLGYHSINDDLTNNGGLGASLDIIKVERVKKTEVVYERKEEILDEAERKYLSGVIRPFRNKVKYIKKVRCFYDKCEYIHIELEEDNRGLLPDFKKGTMYKGMKREKEYTLKELGL